MSAPWKGGKVPWGVVPAECQKAWGMDAPDELPVHGLSSDEWEELSRTEQLELLRAWKEKAEGVVDSLRVIIAVAQKKWQLP